MRLPLARCLIVTFITLSLVLPAEPSSAAPARPNDVTVENCSDDSAFNTAMIGGGTVTFNCGGNHETATITLSKTYTIGISKTIDGDNNKVTLDGGHSLQLFIVNNSVSFNLKNINLANGYGSSSNGGTIVNNGFLSLDHVTIQDASNSNFSGGAIFTTGAIDATNSTFVNNKAGNGGAIYATGSNANVTLAGSVLHDNSVTTGDPNGNRGGAIYLDSGAQVQIFSSEIYSNSARYGGAIASYTATLQLNNVNVYNNGSSAVKSGNGGALDNEGAATANLTNVTFANNQLRLGDGGAIYNKGTATLNNVLMTGNSSTYGGGIANDSGTLNFTNGLVSGNVVNVAGGGGIANEFGTMTLTNLTVSGNFASGDAGGVENGRGTATLTNVTISGNTADSGGGMWNLFGGTATLTNVTISDNRALDMGGGIGNSNDPNTHLHLTNVVISKGSGGDNCAFQKAPDSSDSNLSSDASCNFATLGTGRDNVVLKLGKLETNGGALVGVGQVGLLTQRLLRGSPAIDAGDDSACSASPVSGKDERGVARPQGAHCDAGAFESIPCPNAPGKPALIAPVNKSTVATPQVVLDWAGPDCATKWSVVVRKGSKTGAIVFSKTKLRLSQVTTGALSSGKYAWQVTACAGKVCTAGAWWKFTLQ